MRATIRLAQGCILAIALTYISDQSGHRLFCIQSWIRASGMTEFFRKNKLALAGSIIVAALTLAAIFAPWLAPYDPAAQNIAGASGSVHRGSIHLGNDELGRDILSRILLGARVSMRVGATVVLLSGNSRRLDRGICRLHRWKARYVCDGRWSSILLMAFPGILLRSRWWLSLARVSIA